MSNPLTDVLPAKVRKYVYAVCFVVLLGFTAWQAAEGNVAEALIGFLGSLASATAGSNVDTATDESA